MTSYWLKDTREEQVGDSASLPGAESAATAISSREGANKTLWHGVVVGKHDGWIRSFCRGPSQLSNGDGSKENAVLNFT
jgi:hypothetical protein